MGIGIGVKGLYNHFPVLTYEKTTQNLLLTQSSKFDLNVGVKTHIKEIFGYKLLS